MVFAAASFVDMPEVCSRLGTRVRPIVIVCITQTQEHEPCHVSAWFGTTRRRDTPRFKDSGEVI